jgi:hypothetical protein
MNALARSSVGFQRLGRPFSSNLNFSSNLQTKKKKEERVLLENKVISVEEQRKEEKKNESRTYFFSMINGK